MNVTWARLVCVALISVGASGCIHYSLEELRHTVPTGDPFHNALALQYLDMAAAQEKAYDWYNSMHFADKGLTAAYGKDVAPEEVQLWNVPEEIVPVLEKSRAALVAALTPENQKNNAEAAAAAQVYFDCWIHRQEQGTKLDEIARCHEGFDENLAHLSGGVAPVAAAETAAAPEGEVLAEAPAAETTARAAVPAATPVPNANAPALSSFVVFFPEGKSTLTKEGKERIDDIVANLHKGHYQVILKGHLEVPPKAAPDLTLWQARAETAKKELLAKGVPDGAIVLAGFMETDPASAKGVTQKVELYLHE